MWGKYPGAFSPLVAAIQGGDILIHRVLTWLARGCRGLVRRRSSRYVITERRRGDRRTRHETVESGAVRVVLFQQTRHVGAEKHAVFCSCLFPRSACDVTWGIRTVPADVADVDHHWREQIVVLCYNMSYMYPYFYINVICHICIRIVVNITDFTHKCPFLF